MQIQLKTIFGELIIEGDFSSIVHAIRAAITAGKSVRYANLTRADLTDANLTRADLTRADLTRANLTRANLTRADLTRANLTRADLTQIKHDFFAVLIYAINEVPFLRAALLAGQVDGSTYRGACACLVGTIAKARSCDVQELAGLRPNSARPAERFFMGIRPGSTPENNPAARLAVEWVDEFTMLIASQTPAVK